jgi:hypothetical protein
MTSPTKDEDLELYWDDLRVAPHRKNPTPDELRETLQADKNDLVIGTSAGRLLVSIKPNGTLQYGPEYHPDEAAEVFWEAMARKRGQFEERMLVFAHMEQLLTRIGAQDMEVERLRMAAQEENLPDTEKAQREQYAELALRRLEIWVHQVIELGRALIRRPEVPVAAPGVDSGGSET